MDTTQLYWFSIWYRNNITDNDFISAYSDFIINTQTVIKHSDRQDIKDSYISKITDSLDKLHNFLDVNYLTQQECDILSKLGLKFVILNNPTKTLTDFAYQSNDLTSFLSILNEHKRSLEIAGNYFSAIENSLSNLFGYSGENYVNDKQNNIVKIHFKEHASINNIAELKSWSDKWYKITRGLSGIIDARPEDFVVSGASTGSVIFDIVINNDLLTVFQETIGHIAEVTSAYYAFKKTLLELKSHSQNDTTEKSSETFAHIETIIESKLNDVLDNKIKDMIQNGTIKNDSPEAITNFKKSVHDTQDFLEKGGDFDLRTTQHEIQSKIKITQENIKKIHKAAPHTLLIKKENEEHLDSD
ncbi:hypothetical protein P5G63_11220 [Aeromonas salmonicida]|uniref:hypothetical protein n=2 Tax=Aeromonas salmonicida TaxID=645 RepID=UPI0023F12C08|nr:hypothetical protein [Aeromonas salmonicida]MDF8329036.1 hypothetical protein [Aeromonas salmonicida]